MRYFTFKGRKRKASGTQESPPGAAPQKAPHSTAQQTQKPASKSASKSPSASGTKPKQTQIGKWEAAIAAMKGMFRDCSDVVYHEIVFSHGIKGCVIFIDGIVKTEEIGNHALLPLLGLEDVPTQPAELERQTLMVPQTSRCATYEEAAEAVLAGNAVLFVQNREEAVVLHIRGGNRRGVEEPQTESVIRGPREGFVENLRTNTALLRFKIKSAKLKMKTMVIGEQTKTTVVLSYMEGIIDPKLVEEAMKRLSAIRIDGILESGYIEEMIEDQPLSPFPQLQYTERPDAAAAALLEGRFAIFVDGTPFVLIGPVTFWQFMQASEDYYERYIIGNLIRWLRIFFSAVALYLPALYVAVTTFHQDMLPTNLLLSIAAARETIPFPAIVEALIMEVAFEALREAGIRLPRTVGQAVSILGALVIGQAAVQAGIVSAPMVIVVSLTGIASFTIPRFNMAISVRMLRFPLMILAGVFGLFGIIIGTVLIAVHMCSLRSFGIPYLSGIAPYDAKEQKDILVRMPWWKMSTRPGTFSPVNRRRLGQAGPSAKKRGGGAP
jgi:spore germination protein KA